MNSMPGAGGAGGGGYGGVPGGVAGGAGGQQPPGAPIDHQQQQQQMMMRQQQMAYMQQQHQAGMRGGMLPPGMQQQQQMMQQQNMYGMQPGQQQQPQQPVDPAQLQQMRARQAQMQQMAQQNPLAHQQHMLERFRNMSEEQRQAMMLQRQQQQQMAAARGGAGYPPGMQQTPGGPMGGGHLGGPSQQPGSSGMGVMTAGGPGGSGAGGGGGLPSHYIKQEPLGVPGGAAGMGGMMGHPGGPHMMQIKQEQGMHNIKQEPGAGSSSMGAMQHQQQPQQHPGAAAAPSDDSPQAAAMQHMQQQAPANMARMQHARQQAAMRQQQAAAMQSGAVDPSMTVQQHAQQLIAAKQAAAQQQAASAAGGHNMPPGMPPQQMDHMMAQRHHQQLIFQQHQATMQAQQQGMTMQQMQQQRHMLQQQQAAAAASSMGPPSQIQLQQQQPAAAPAAAPPAAAAPAVDEEEVREFKRSVETLKEKYGQTVERMIKRAAPGENMPRFINLCKEFFDGSRPYSPENLKTAKRLQRDMDSMLERQSVTAGITMALDAMARAEERRKDEGEMEEKPASSSSSSSTRMAVLPSPWPLDVRARRVRVPDALSRHVRSRRMDERLISRRKRHADVMRDEEDLPLWSARRMRHEPDLDAELEEMERMEPPKKDYKMAAEPDLPPPVVNSIPRGDAMEQALKRRQSGQQSRLHAKMPEEAMKELSVLRWRMVSDARLNFAETITFMVAIAAGHTQAVPPLHVLIHADYPERPASVLFEKSFPKSHPSLRRLGEVVEARLAAAPLSVQGRISTMAEIYKSACEAFFTRGAGGAPTKMSVLQQSGPTVKTEPLDQSTPSPDSASSSTSTSPADPSALPPTIPMLSHLPTTYRPQAKFRATVDPGNAKSRMVY